MRYTIRNNGVRFWTGTLKDGRQVLLGPNLPHIDIYLFDAQGKWVGKESRPMANPPAWDAQAGVYITGSQFLDSMEQEVQALCQKMGLTPADIVVQPFQDDEGGVGIKSLPTEYEEYLGMSSGYSQDDKESLEESIAEWRREGRFVFSWGEELWLSPDGEVL